jgi:hypothetical protein
MKVELPSEWLDDGSAKLGINRAIVEELAHYAVSTEIDLHFLAHYFRSREHNEVEIHFSNPE